MKIIAKYLLILLLLCFIFLGSYFVRSSTATPSVTWGFIFAPESFTHITFVELYSFYKELRIPIPPVISLSEILCIRFTGSAQLITKHLYRLSLIASYLLAIILANKSTTRLIASFFISTIFLYATVKIHPGNPQVYDILFPLFFLMYVFLIKKSVDKEFLDKSKTGIIILTILSGFFLSMAELSRPFVIFILPLLVLSSYFILKESSLMNQFTFFIIPVILLSGMWHLHLLINYGQISFTNHSGFNLTRAWKIPPVKLIEEIHDTPLGDGMWDNLNTEEHTINSNLLQKAVFTYWLKNPKASILMAIERINIFLSANTEYKYKPESKWFGLYKLLVKITSSLLLVNFGILILFIFNNFNPSQIVRSLTNTENLMIIFATYCIAILSIGESGEEPRLLISILPMLATLPMFFNSLDS